VSDILAAYGRPVKHPNWQTRTLEIVPTRGGVGAERIARYLADKWRRIGRAGRAMRSRIVVDQCDPVDFRLFASDFRLPIKVCWPCGCPVTCWDSHVHKDGAEKQAA
jgi:hypothetical protein